ncbi:MAG: hypothetical protein LIP18_01510, partial [Planctomycetes bacterium]|nr:hypothetical protein [Planctomycetota bacterium]
EENLHLLSLEVTKSNSNLENARAKVKDTGDPFGEHKAIAFFRKFLTEAPDLKSALVTVESQPAIEVEPLRTPSE